MKRVQLSEVAEFINGRAFKPEEWETDGLPIIRIQNLTGSTDTINYYSGNVEPKYLVKDDDILISWSASLGVYRWQGGNAILNQHIFKVELKEKLIDKDYFYYAAQNALVEMERHIHGATMQHITRDPFLAIEIPLPPLTEQKRIASLLARADRLRHLRRTAHDLGESLLQSVFLEMFGDGSKFDRVEFEEILAEDPKNGLYLPAEKYGSGTPIIRIDAFYDGVLGNPKLFKRVEATEQQVKEFCVENGEILINRVNSLEYLGKCAFVMGLIEPTLFESNMMRIRLNQEIAHPVYVTKYLTTQNAYSQIMQRAKKAVNQASINQQDVKSLVIPIPPLSLQEEFAGVVARVESLRGRMGESARQVEGLFESLLAEAFS